MKHSKTLPSPLKIAAEVDAALAAAGLMDSQVEREAIPLYYDFLEELVDAEGKLALNFHLLGPRELAKHLVNWAREKDYNEQYLLSSINEQFEEVQLLTRAHSTLSDMKRRKLLNLHQQTVDLICYFFTQTSIKAHNKL